MTCRIEMMVLAAFAAVTAAYTVRAADYSFSKDGGNLASAADWGMESIPDPTNRIAFTTGGTMTVTALDDINFSGAYMQKANQTITLDMRDSVTGGNPRKINFTGGISFGDGKYQTLNIKGGDWTLGGAINMFTGNYNNEKTYETVNITDGAVVRTSGLRGSYSRTSHCTFHIAGEGTVVTSGYLQVPFIDGHYDRAEILDGAQVIITNASNGGINLANRDSCNCGIVVSGAGSRLAKIAGGTTYIVNKATNNYFYVENGAEVNLSAGLVYFAYADDVTGKNAASNILRAAGAGARIKYAAIYFGKGGAADANTANEIQAFDGGSITGQIAYVYGHDNGHVVSNATIVYTGNGIVCNSSCTNCYLRLQGDSPRFMINSGASGNWDLRNSFKLIYDLPPDGYAEGFVPVYLTRWGTTDTTTEFIINGIDAVKRRMAQRRMSSMLFKLFRPAGGIGGSGFTAEMCERWNSRLPEGAELKWENGFVTLTVKITVGTCVMFH